MSSGGKLVAVALLGIVGIYFGWIVLKALIGAVLGLLIPVAVLGVVIYAVYRLSGGQRSLPGGGRRTLP